MNWLDFTLAGVLVVCVIEGACKGFVRTGLDFLMMLAGVVCGLWFFHPLSFLLRPYIRPKQFAEWIAFLAIFGAVMFAGFFLQFHFRRMIKAADLSWLDRLVGGGFGVIRGAAIAAVAVMVVMAVAPAPVPQAVTESRFAPALIDGARCAAAVAPDEVRAGFRQACREIERSVPPKWQKSIGRLRSI